MKELDEKFIEKAHILIGANVKRLREAKGLTQLELSLTIGHKSVSVISCAEIYHKKQHFNITHLLQISRVLGVEMSEFFKGVDELKLSMGGGVAYSLEDC